MSWGLGALILQGLDKRRVPWPTKLLRLVLRQWKSIMALKLCYTTQVYTRAQQIWFALHNGKETIVDFKQSNRPKKEEWIEDYYMQIAMYAMAHDYVYGSKIEQGVIMVCTPDLYYQEFKTEGADLRAWKHKALKRINMYNELMHDEKENIIKHSDLPGLLQEMTKGKK